MESDQLTPDEIMLHKKQMIAFMDMIIDQKKLLFKQLMAEIDGLDSEINQLQTERKTVLSASAEKSLIDCRR